MREEIDLARQTRRRLKERFNGRRIEERELGAGEAEPMDEVAGELVASERGHVMTDHMFGLDRNEALNPFNRF
jgi:hypothetical protein